MTNRERVSLTASSLSEGRWEISTGFFLSYPDARYLTSWKPVAETGKRMRHTIPCRRGTRLEGNPTRSDSPPGGSLRVELDDELLRDGRVDLRPLRQLVDQDAQVGLHDLEPRRDRPVAEGSARGLEGQRGQRLRLHVDDVELRHPEARDVDLLDVHDEVTVADQLAGLTTGARETRAVHHVVEPGLQDLQQVLTGLAGAANRFLVVAPELLL